MSVDTWINEFMSIEADEVEGNNEDYLNHSIKKWYGLQSENLSKHKMKVGGVDYFSVIEDNEGKTVVVGSQSCALCVHHLDDGSCGSCPIVRFTGRACDESDEKDEMSPWGEWVKNKNPKPMIVLLEETLEWVKKER